MPYELSIDAENDLREVARYTRKTWGKAQLKKYRDGLKATFDAIGTHGVIARQFSETYPDLWVTRYQHHYIFYIAEKGAIPCIIGVIHGKMDIFKHLASRLS